MKLGILIVGEIWKPRRCRAGKNSVSAFAG